MRKIKPISILFLTMLLVLSILVAPAYAATNYNGSNLPSNYTGVAIKSDGMGGKTTSDNYYAINAKCGSWSKYDSAFVLPNFMNTFEGQFMLNASDSVFHIRMKVHTTSKSSSGTKYLYIDFKATGVYCYEHTSDEEELKWSKKMTLVPGHWYTFAAEFGDDSADSGAQQAQYYLNGVNIHSGKEFEAMRGVRNWAVAAKSANKTVFVDNIIVTNGRGVTASETHVVNAATSTPSVISSLAEGYTLSGDVVTVPYGTDVQSLVSAISTTDGSGDVIRVYTDSTMSNIADNSAKAANTKIVIAAKNGTDTEQAYSYYTVNEAEHDADVLKGKTADDIYLNNNTTEPVTVVETANNAYGKASEDSVYKITNNNGAAVNLAQCLLGKNTFSKGTGALEFSFALPEGSSGFTMTNSTGHTETSYEALTELTFNTNGIWSGSSMQNCIYSGLEAEKWYNIAIEMATDGSNTFNIYLNGTQVYEVKDSSNSWYGFRTAYIKMKDKNGGVMYLDNISASKSYDNANNIPAQISGNKFVLKNGKFLALNGISTADITMAEDNAYRLDNSDWSVAESFEDAEIIVFTAKNGRSMERAYTYYNVDCSDCIIDYELSGKSGSEKLTSDI